MLHEKDDDKGSARAAFRRGTELGQAEAATHLCVLLCNSGQPEDAEEALRSAIELWEGRRDERGLDNVRALTFMVGFHYLLRGSDEEATKVWRKGVELGDFNSAIHLGSLRLKEDPAEAEDAFRKALELSDGNMAQTLGLTLLDNGDTTGAEVAFRKGMELGNGIAAHNLGGLLHNRGDDAGAHTALRTGLRLGNGYAGVTLGVLLEEKNDLTGAEMAL